MKHVLKKTATTSQTGPTLNIYQCSCGARFGAKTKEEANSKMAHKEE
jgi:hypothetical protein